MRRVVASGLFSCVLVAGLLALGAEDTSSPGTRSSASAKFLTRALGETRDAFLARHTRALYAAGAVFLAGFREAVRHRDEPFGDHGRKASGV